MSQEVLLYTGICVLVLIIAALVLRQLSTAQHDPREPPFVHIPRDILLSSRGHNAYATAFAENGPVFMLERHGRKEYMIDHRYAYEVLTNSKDFRFDKGVVKVLYMEFIMWFKDGTFVQELDDVVIRGVQNRLDEVVQHVLPTVQDEFQQHVNGALQTGEMTKGYEAVQRTVARAMTILILGPDFCTEDMTDNFVTITAAVCHLAGIYQNTQGSKHFPQFFHLLTVLRAIFGTIVPCLFTGILPQLWRHRTVPRTPSDKSTSFTPIFDTVLSRHWSPKQNPIIGFGNFLWATVVCVGLIFASVHQTVVVAMWVMVQLAEKKDEYLDEIREEWDAAVQIDPVTGQPLIDLDSLNRLGKLDSFIREVMRLKSDTMAPVRFTTRPVQVGPYVIPKDAYCAPYVKQAHEHPDNYGPDGSVFKGFQWYEQQRPAGQGTNSFISFGLGRWACPGRHLAINEIKTLVYVMFSQYDVSLKGGVYKVTDPMNTTSVPPEAAFEFRRRIS